MGAGFSDRYSLLHFAVGIIAYFWNVSFVAWFILHMIYELTENTNYAMKIINRFPYWPGGKEKADSLLNSAGDQFYGMLGWLVAYIVSTYSFTF
jgi:hypothetical protein